MRFSFVAFCISLSLSLVALNPADNKIVPRQDILRNPNKAGGIYFAYPVEDIAEPAVEIPQGYEPFYLSHYGRHGSRYLISDNDYKSVIDVLHKAYEADALTPLGVDVMHRIDSVWVEAQGRGGELTPLGVRQHRGIARRVGTAFPQIFADSAIVTAASTVVMRCAHSMFAFIEGLKELNPQLMVERESSQRNMDYLNYHSEESAPYSSHKGPWYQDYKRFKKEKTNPGRLMSTLFSDNEYLNRWIDQDELMWGLYWLAVDMQNIETKLDLSDIFTNDELFDLYEVFNFNFYACNSSYPLANGQHIYNARNLLANILENADRYIQQDQHGATLRFGHDGNIIPLVALMQIDGCYSDAIAPDELSNSGYATYHISPMASNLQMIFFRNKANKDDLLVRVLLNEQPALMPLAQQGEGLYRWTDLREFLASKL